jgi:hypothetical protein
MSESRPTADGVDARIRWIREWTTPGFAHFRIGRDGDDLVAEWKGLGTLRAARSGRSHVFTPCPDRGDSTEGVREAIVQGLLRHLHGKMSLHASAAARGNRAVVILGESMAGKSTLVAELCTRNGFEMLADDTVFLEQRGAEFYVVPTESTHSLREGAAQLFGASTGDLQKAYVPSASFASDPARLCAFVSLSFEESMTKATLRIMPGSEIFRVLYAALFRFVIDENDVTLQDFSRMAELADAVPFFELRRPPSLDLLRESATMLCTQVALPLPGEHE